jgi:hypothetical protein
LLIGRFITKSKSPPTHQIPLNLPLSRETYKIQNLQEERKMFPLDKGGSRRQGDLRKIIFLMKF